MSSPKKVTSAVTQHLPKGWRRRIYLRTKGASAGRKDVVLISPDDFILRSNVEIERYAKTNKMKLDPKVYTVSLLAVENIFKHEAGRLLAKPKTSISSPISQNENKKGYIKKVLRKSTTSRASVLTEAAPSNVIRKSVTKEDTPPPPRKRGRPRKDQSLILAKKIVRHSFSLRRKSAPPAKAESKSKVEPATKRRRSGDSGTGREEKRGKFEDSSPPIAAAGRQTRNSISAIEIPILSPKIKKHRSVSPDKVAKGEKVDPEKRRSIQPEKKQESSRQFRGYGSNTDGKQGALDDADAIVEALLDEVTSGEEETDEDEELVESAEQPESVEIDAVDLADQTTTPIAESTQSKVF
jgi:hypothetical protein